RPFASWYTRPCRPLLIPFSCRVQTDWQPEPGTTRITGNGLSVAPPGDFDRYAVIVLPSASLAVKRSKGTPSLAVSFASGGPLPSARQQQTRRTIHASS